MRSHLDHVIFVSKHTDASTFIQLRRAAALERRSEACSFALLESCVKLQCHALNDVKWLDPSEETRPEMKISDVAREVRAE